MDQGLDPRTSLEDAAPRLDANVFVVDARSARLRRISWWSRVVGMSAIGVGLVVVLGEWSSEDFDLRSFAPMYIVAAIANAVSSVAQGLLLKNRGPAANPAGHYLAAGVSGVVAVVLIVVLAR